MDRKWMDANRLSKEYARGVDEFIDVAVKLYGQHNKHIPCPCVRCGNFDRASVTKIKSHLVEYGIDRTYRRWIWHGEIDNSGLEHSDDDEEDEGDRLEDMMVVAQDNLNGSVDEINYLLAACQKPLYNGCSKFSKLSATLKLYNLKAANGWTEKSFTQLLELFKDMLPDDNVLHSRTYEAKKMLSTMGMSYERIHACPNDCILYRGEYALLERCPKLGCNESRYKRDKIPRKVLWYFPIIPRLKRMFRIEEEAKNLIWHASGKSTDGKLRHPVDSPQWRFIDNKFRAFGDEKRNIRFALSTDGMSPYGTLSSIYSVWPVLMVIYNLPPWLCMKRKYMMLSLLISGPKQPGNDIDVYLTPLIEELKLLWDTGVEVFDANKQEVFNLRALLFCTINDFPAYGNLSGYSVKGHHACPICEMDTNYYQLSESSKTVYFGYRRFLPTDHHFRRQKKNFNGFQEQGLAPQPLTGQQVYERVKDIEVSFGKKNEYGKKNTVKAVNGWKKKSIFFSLPYWKFLFVRHCLDVMHIEKNVCDSIVGTLLNVPGKTKDGIKARLDLEAMGIRSELLPQQKGNRKYLPPACYTLSRKEKVAFCEFIDGVKVPSGYSSNIRSLVSMNDLKLVGLKSHDCHILMQEFLPIALRPILPKHVRFTIIRLCLFFKAICSKVIDVAHLQSLQDDIVITLCKLQMYFLLSFFDIMVHLVVHLVREVRLCGPVYLRWMYPFERYMKVLKSYVMNKNCPEGSIVQRYITEEAIEFCSEYLSNVEAIGLPKSRRLDVVEGEGITGAKLVVITRATLNQAHLYVLHNDVEVSPYEEEHKGILRQQNRSRNENWIVNEHNRTFVAWFEEKISAELQIGGNSISDHLRWLSYGPKTEAVHFSSYITNGYTFYTKEHDSKSPMQNSGVTLTAEALHVSSSKDKNPIYAGMQYYGVIEKIFELDYTTFRVAIFDCQWVDNNSAIKVDELGFTLVDLNRYGHKEDPFIFASQAKQVFYVKDPSDNKWSVVIASRRRFSSDDLENEDEDISDTIVAPSFPSMGDDNIDQEFYAREDHDEGMFVEDLNVKPGTRAKKRRRVDNTTKKTG